MLGLLRYVHSQLAKAELSSFCSWLCPSWIGVVLSACIVWWDIGANFLNYLSICTACSDDPLRAHRIRVNQKLERYSDNCDCTLLCESAILVEGKSFVTLYTDFSFKKLMENALVKEFSSLLKEKCFRDKRPKGFSFTCYRIFL